MTRSSRAFALTAFLACASALAPRAHAQVAVVDDFESGSLAGWTLAGRNQAAILTAANVNGATVTPPGGARFLALSTGPGDRGGGAILYDDNTINEFDLTTISRTITFDFGTAPAVLAFDWTLPSGEQDQDLQYDDVFDVRVALNGGALTQVFARSTCRTGSRSNYPDSPCSTGNATIVNAAPITNTALRFGVGPFQRVCVPLASNAGSNTITVRFAIADQGDSGFDTAAFIDDVEVRTTCDIVGDATLRQVTTSPASFTVQPKGGGLEARPIASRRLAADASGANVAFASSANLTGDNPNAIEQLWFHNGTAFTRLTSYTHAADGGRPTIEAISVAAGASAAQAARYVAFAARATASDNVEIYRLDRTSNAITQITTTTGCTNTNPSITDNATIIAYESDCAAETGVAAGVKRVVYRSSTGNYATVVRPMATNLTPATCYGRNPVVARGGTHLALESTCPLVAANADGSLEVFRLQVSNGNWTAVSLDAESTSIFAASPSITPDGRYVLYLSNGEQDNINDGIALNADGSFEAIRWDANGANNENRSQVTNGTQLLQVTAARIAANASYFVFERLDVLSGTFALVRQSNTTFGTTPAQRLIANGDSFQSWELGSDPTTASIGVVPFVSDEDHVPPGNADGNLEFFSARVPQ